MLEFFQFATSGLWRFFGVIIILIVLAAIIEDVCNVIISIFRRRP